MKLTTSLLFLSLAAASAQDDAQQPESTYRSEFKILDGHTVKDDYKLAMPHEYLDAEKLPEAFSWGDVDGVSYLTKSLNQHIPQYCGSCWAHGAMSALSDRIKIARGADAQDEINLSIQYILNCGSAVAGSCYGGSATGAYEFAKKAGSIPYDTCQPYISCSSDSNEGFCGSVDTTCSAFNTCRTCGTFSKTMECTEIAYYPNATISEYGTVPRFDVDAIKAEIFARGPVAAGINAEPILDYSGGIVRDTKFWHKMINHIVSIVGWGKDSETGDQYWIIRNSWGQYWGEMGYVRVIMGHNALGIESEVSWATPDIFTVTNYPCSEDGNNCRMEHGHLQYADPSLKIKEKSHRLAAFSKDDAVNSKDEDVKSTYLRTA